MADYVDWFVAKDRLVHMLDVVDQGNDVVRFKVDQALRSWTVASPMTQVVVAYDSDIEVFGEEGGKVLVVAGEVLCVTVREKDDRFDVLVAIQ